MGDDSQVSLDIHSNLSQRMMVSIIIPVLAFAATVEASSYPKTSDCFTLEGFATNGTSLGFLRVGTLFFALPPFPTTFSTSKADATRLGIDAKTSHLIDLNEGFALGDSVPHKGLTADVVQSGGYSDWIIFETPLALQNQETQPARVAIRCELDHRNRLTCVHPNISNYNVFQYCVAQVTIWNWSELKLGIGIDPPGQFLCEAVSIIATAAHGCVGKA